MRQFATVSYSPWANPYSSGPNAGKNIYAAPASPPQPVYRRIVLPAAPTFYHPGVEQVVGEESDDDDSEEGTSWCQSACGLIHTNGSKVKQVFPSITPL